MIPIVLAMIPWTRDSPVPTIAAAPWVSIDITPPWVDNAAVSAPACAPLTVVAAAACPVHTWSRASSAPEPIPMDISSICDRPSRIIVGSRSPPPRLPVPKPPSRSVIGLINTLRSSGGSGGRPGSGGMADNSGRPGRPRSARTLLTGVSRIGPSGLDSTSSRMVGSSGAATGFGVKFGVLTWSPDRSLQR
ncbi:hypothetical protein BFL43_25380 [Williamsia sp. 1135]|nr:hypothetical protein BFL43_25380 [Williamsia sp. 1135]